MHNFIVVNISVQMKMQSNEWIRKLSEVGHPVQQTQNLIHNLNRKEYLVSETKFPCLKFPLIMFPVFI